MMELADSWSKQLLGLMFRRPGTYNLVFIFGRPVRSPVHTWFCRMPITMSFIGVDGEVEVFRDVAPWRVVRPARPYVKLVENTLNED